MNRTAIGYIVTPLGATSLPYAAHVELSWEADGRVRALVDDGGHAVWCPPLSEPPVTPFETETEMRIEYAGGAAGERGISLTPVTVETWNVAAARRPEMQPAQMWRDVAEYMAW